MLHRRILVAARGNFPYVSFKAGKAIGSVWARGFPKPQVWKIKMLRSLAIAAAFAAVALPAAAASVTVNISGLDAVAAHAKIKQAAVEACALELSDESSVTRYYEQESCIAQAVSSTEAKLAQADHTLAKL